MGYLDGFRVTLKKLVEERLTRDYAKDEGGKRVKPARMHGRHVLNRYEDGMEKCIGCELCAGVCPARCIYVRGADNPPDDPVSPGERYGYIYEINYLRCIHCDLCVEACPTEAITETKLFEFSFTNRADAIYTKAELVVDDDGRPRRLPWEDWTDLDKVERHTSAWMRATSPSGAAAYEGRLAWGGELGYGVRPPEAGQSSPEGGGPTSGESAAIFTHPRVPQGLEPSDEVAHGPEVPVPAGAGQGSPRRERSPAADDGPDGAGDSQAGDADRAASGRDGNAGAGDAGGERLEGGHQ